MKLDVKDFERKMQKSIEAYENELKSIRAGRANPGVLDKITVDYYGSPTQISSVAQVSVPDARTITITPWDKTMLKASKKQFRRPNSASTRRTTAPCSACPSRR